MTPPTAKDAGDGWPIVPPGIWLEARREPFPKSRPGLFLDRDGVVVEDVGFLARTEDVRLVPGIATLIAAANREGVPVSVVTNQSGIARGLFGWAEFAEVEREIKRALGAAGAMLDAVLACPFHPEFTTGYREIHSHWRKPGPGLPLAAARVLNVEIGRSWLIGDRNRDVEAARNAGLAGAILLGGADADPTRGGPRLDFRAVTATTPLEALSILEESGLFAVRD